MKEPVHITSAYLYAKAATALGLKHSYIKEGKILLNIFSETKQILITENSLNLNPEESISTSRNKVRTSKILQDKDIPAPRFTMFEEQKPALNYALKMMKKKTGIVIKPISGSNAVGICINPQTSEQARQAIIAAFERSDQIIIEEYIQGNHYRITILDDEIIAISQRIPGNVKTDGIHSLDELIMKKNVRRSRNGLPTIVLRKSDYEYLAFSHICLTEIYTKGERILLQQGCDFEIGGDRDRIELDSVPEENLKMFVKAVKLLGLRFGGIDYISSDITKPYTSVSSAINEINHLPYQAIHYYDSQPCDNYAAKRIIEKLFEKSAD